MNFVSSTFLLFLLICLIGFYALPRKFRAAWLLFASYIFYASWSFKFIAIILFTTTVDYFLSKLIEKNRGNTSIMRRCLLTGVLCNLLILFFFKYLNFSLANFNSLTEVFHLPVKHMPHYDLILPLGISFYTFEAISYLVDVYRGRKPAKDFFSYNFYIMYFPHLISGPIVRFNQLSKQYEEGIALPSRATIQKGIELTLLGFAFKILLANQIAPIVDSVYEDPLQKFNALNVWIVAFAFSSQMYFDFLGYTHIARGVSLLFNIELPLNFRHPFNVDTVTEFWQRWHISLSSWIRDYLYIPLCKIKSPVLPRPLIMVVVMVILGLWHGAGWTFAAFGLYHGIWLTIDPHISKHLRKIFGVRGNYHRVYPTFASVPTFIALIASSILFRSHSLTQAMMLYKSGSHLKAGFNAILTEVSQNNWTSISTIIFLVCTLKAGPFLADLFESEFLPTPFWVRCTAAWLLIATVWVGASDNYVPFLYFQF